MSTRQNLKEAAVSGRSVRVVKTYSFQKTRDTLDISGVVLERSVVDREDFFALSPADTLDGVMIRGKGIARALIAAFELLP